MTNIAVLGAGMAGFGATHRLHTEGVPSVLYEKKLYHGGHTASYGFDGGFIFDDGPHISFTKDKRIQQLFAQSVDNEYEVVMTRVNNYWNGHWIKHPAQCNLYGLPTDLVVKILRDFVSAQSSGRNKIKNYSDWLVASYGRAFAETFPMTYGLKYHTTSADNMTTDWLGPRLYQPTLEEMLRGALTPTTSDVHYVSGVRYPSKNGFVSFLNMFLDQTELRLGHKLTKISPGDRELHFANGFVASYDHCISSIPLPELIPMISGVPHDVLDAARKLACTQCVVVNIGINREDISDSHWTYFYDRDFVFARLSFPHMFSPNNTPHGAGSIQAEVYHSREYRPLDRRPEEYIEPVIADLRRCGLIHEKDEIVFRNAWLIPYANVIFDLKRASALAVVHGYLDDIGIKYCGRYGEWGYHWTDESFISGEMAAQKVLESKDSRSRTVIH